MRPRLATWLLVLLVAVRAAGEDAVPDSLPVSVRAHVEADTVAIGAAFRYTVEVTTAPGVEVVVAQPTERIGDFEILDFGVEPSTTRAGRTVLTRWYTLVGYTPGHYLVPSPPVQYRVAATALREAPGHEIRVSVDSLLGRAPDAKDIRDIKGPEAIPVDRRPYYLVGGGLVAALALGLLLHRLLNRPRRQRPAPPKPAHVIAAEELEGLRQRRLIMEGAFKEYYSALSGIVRTYLEQRFRVRAPEMTTEEFLVASARDGRLQGSHRRLLGEFLAESDLVKFARHLPTIEDSDRAWHAAKRFVDETAEQQTPAEGERAAG